ncbi:MAG TPA: hypothetical protein VM580_14070 [Labilithrix sp.]|nr:hypothetical protein [Labilithrix sp.]
MPEATALYVVTAVVLAVLVVWVAAVLKTAKEPWARAMGPDAATATATDAATCDPSELELPRTSDAPKFDADSTARATPVALAVEKAKLGSAVTTESTPGADVTDEEKAGV